MSKNLPLKCPSCNSKLKVKSMFCDDCETIVSGEFDLPILLTLEPKEQQFILEFIKCSGSLKIMAQNMGLSYPTVRNILDDIIQKIESHGK
ncbi:MAG: DUF2089 family protein [Bacteroidales bacterium]|nr:DUF2089 family protein [Bacteroidales bacterium]